jgi:hypothetical protein
MKTEIQIKCLKTWKEDLREIAAEQDMSITTYIKNAVNKQLKSDKRKRL